jgi:hypothetical protein
LHGCLAKIPTYKNSAIKILLWHTEIVVKKLPVAIDVNVNMITVSNAAATTMTADLIVRISR